MSNVISGDKLFYWVDRAVWSKRPITADIFLTDYCNNRCHYCTYDEWGIKKMYRHMPLENVKKYVSRMYDLGVRGFIFTGGGEPTIHPQFEEICQWMDEKGYSYGINTNFNDLRLVKPKFLKVSLDAWDEGSYKKIRGVANYGKVRQNIISYDAWRKEHSPNTSLGIQMVVVNACDIEKFYSANADLPVDYISFRPVESKQGEFYSGKQAAEQYLSIVETLNSLSVSDSRVKLNYKWKFIQPENKLSKCAANWSQIAINEKGQVMYCCNKPTEIVGHIMDDDILDKKARYNTNMELCRIPCRLTGPNEALKHILRDKDSSCFI